MTSDCFYKCIGCNTCCIVKIMDSPPRGMRYNIKIVFSKNKDKFNKVCFTYNGLLRRMSTIDLLEI